MRPFPSLSSLLVLAALAGCAATAPGDPKLQIGVYGGQGARITVDSSIVGFGFDCAGGAVDHAIVLAPDGSFDAVGTWIDEGNAHGVDHTPQPARYRGQVIGTHIRFELLKPPESTTPSGPFDVQLGVAPMMIAC